MPEPTAAPKTILSGAQIARVATVLMGSFILTALLGVVRSSIIGSRFGLGSEADAFYSGNRVAETLFSLVSGGALGSAFIPVFSRFLGLEDRAEAWRLASATLTWVSIIAGVLSLLMWLFAPQVVQYILRPGANEAQQALTVQLLRIMLLTVLVFCVSGLCMAILNAHQRFFAASLTAGVYNLGLIFGAVVLSSFMGIYGLAWGAVIGACLHLAVQIPTLRKIRFSYTPRLANTPGLGEVLRLMLPRVIGLAAFQMNFWVNAALTSDTPGSLTALTTAFALVFTVLGVIGQSVGTAIFPTLSALHNQGETDKFREVLANAMRGVLFMAIPATVGLILLAEPFVEVLFGRANWMRKDTVGVAWALGLYAVGLAGFALQEVLARAFYARRDTWTPVLIAAFGLVLNVILSLVLRQVITGRDPAQGAFGGLALANALTTLIESMILWILLRRALGNIHDRAVLLAAGRVLFAAAVMGVLVYLVTTIAGGLPAFPRLITAAALGAGAFEVVAFGLGLPEARTIPLAFLRRLRR